jgi:hypothetical protein
MQIRVRVLSESSTCRENKYKPSTRLHVEAFLIAMFRYAKAATSFLLERLNHFMAVEALYMLYLVAPVSFTFLFTSLLCPPEIACDSRGLL